MIDILPMVGLYALLNDEQKKKAMNFMEDESFGPKEHLRLNTSKEIRSVVEGHNSMRDLRGSTDNPV